MIKRMRQTVLWLSLASMVSINWPVSAIDDIDSTALRSAIDVEGIWQHLEEFQEIAVENDGNRASGLPGFDMSATYVGDVLLEAGYQVSVQPFDFQFFQELS